MRTLSPDEFEACVWEELRILGADRHPRAPVAVAVIVAMAQPVPDRRPVTVETIATRALAEQVRAAQADALDVIVARRRAAVREACP